MEQCKLVHLNTGTRHQLHEIWVCWKFMHFKLLISNLFALYLVIVIVFLLSGCGGIITQMGEPVLSPNYPNNYPNSVTCVWAIFPGQAFQLQIEEFYTESGYDFLKAYSSVSSFTRK